MKKLKKSNANAFPYFILKKLNNSLQSKKPPNIKSFFPFTYNKNLKCVNKKKYKKLIILEQKSLIHIIKLKTKKMVFK